jgi:hypothetical protein
VSQRKEHPTCDPDCSNHMDDQNKDEYITFPIKAGDPPRRAIPPIRPIPTATLAGSRGENGDHLGAPPNFFSSPK